MAASGLWFGLLVGFLLSLFASSSTQLLRAGGELGRCSVRSSSRSGRSAGYAATGGRRDFTSVSQVVATRYEVLVEHKFAENARQILAGMPGGATSYTA